MEANYILVGPRSARQRADRVDGLGLAPGPGLESVAQHRPPLTEVVVDLHEGRHAALHQGRHHLLGDDGGHHVADGAELLLEVSRRERHGLQRAAAEHHRDVRAVHVARPEGPDQGVGPDDLDGRLGVRDLEGHRGDLLPEEVLGLDVLDVHLGGRHLLRFSPIACLQRYSVEPVYYNTNILIIQ